MVTRRGGRRWRGWRRGRRRGRRRRGWWRGWRRRGRGKRRTHGAHLRHVAGKGDVRASAAAASQRVARRVHRHVERGLVHEGESHGPGQLLSRHCRGVGRVVGGLAVLCRAEDDLLTRQAGRHVQRAAGAPAAVVARHAHLGARVEHVSCDVTPLHSHRLGPVAVAVAHVEVEEAEVEGGDRHRRAGGRVDEGEAQCRHAERVGIEEPDLSELAIERVLGAGRRTVVVASGRNSDDEVEAGAVDRADRREAHLLRVA